MEFTVWLNYALKKLRNLLPKIHKYFQFGIMNEKPARRNNPPPLTPPKHSILEIRLNIHSFYHFRNTQNL